VARTARRIKNVPNRVKATKAKQPEPQIEVEDDLVIDDDDNLDLIDRGDRYKSINYNCLHFIINLFRLTI
jgi:hypothetical protein